MLCDCKAQQLNQAEPGTKKKLPQGIFLTCQILTIDLKMYTTENPYFHDLQILAHSFALALILGTNACPRAIGPSRRQL